MVKSLKILKKQALIILVFSVLISVGLIIHGIFFDLDFQQIKRLTLAGLLFTLVVIYPSIMFLEWAFDINNKKRFDELNARITKLEKKKK